MEERVEFSIRDILDQVIKYDEVEMRESHTYEVVISILGTKSNVWSHVDIKFPLGTLKLIDDGKHEIWKVLHKGHVFYILADYYHFCGNKNNPYDINEHLSQYESGIARKGNSDNGYTSFCYRYRTVKLPKRMEQWITKLRKGAA